MNTGAYALAYFELNTNIRINNDAAEVVGLIPFEIYV